MNQRNFWPLAAFLTLLAGACGADSADPNDGAKPSRLPPLSTATAELAARLCGMNRVRPSPDGSRIALWRAMSPLQTPGLTRALVTSPACIAGGGACATQVSGLGRLRIVGWGVDSSRLFVRYGDSFDELAWDEVEKGFELRGLTPGGLSSRVETVRVGASGSRNAAEEAERFGRAYSEARRRSPNRQAPRLVALDRHDAAAWVGRDTDSRLMLSSSEGPVALPADLRPEIYPVLQISRANGVLNASLPGWSLRSPRSAYEQPVLDGEGVEVGSFTPDGVTTSGDAAWLTQRVASYLGAARGYTLEAVALAGRTHAFLLSTNSSGDMRLTHMSPGETSDIVCHAPQTSEATPALDWKLSAIPANGRQIAINHFSAGGQRRGIVVYYHGGPAASFRDGGYTDVVRRYARLGFDVLAVDGAGSRDTGLEAIGRLRRDAASAIREDAATIATYLRRQNPAYGNVIVHGESFGASQAILTAEVLDADALVLVAPWLNHRPPEALFTGPRAPAQIRTQVAWENAVFGARESVPSTAFREWLSSLTRTTPLQANTLVVFAANDAKSKPEDIAAGSAKVFVVSGASHDRITSSEAAWENVAAHLDGVLLRRAGRPTAHRQ